MKERPYANTVCYCRNWRLRITGKYFYTSIYFRMNKLNPSWFKVLSVLLNPLALNLTLLNLAGKALQCTLHWVEDAICKLITDIIGHYWTHPYNKLVNKNSMLLFNFLVSHAQTQEVFNLTLFFWPLGNVISLSQERGSRFGNPNLVVLERQLVLWLAHWGSVNFSPSL